MTMMLDCIVGAHFPWTTWACIQALYVCTYYFRQVEADAKVQAQPQQHLVPGNIYIATGVVSRASYSIEPINQLYGGI